MGTGAFAWFPPRPDRGGLADHDGHWSNKWHFNPDRNDRGVGYGSSDAHMRHVGFNMTLKTAADKLPGWWLHTGTEVTKKYCC